MRKFEIPKLLFKFFFLLLTKYLTSFNRFYKNLLFYNKIYKTEVTQQINTNNNNFDLKLQWHIIVVKSA